MASPSFWPRIGGVETHVRKVSEELIRLGHAVTVLTPRDDESLPVEESFNGIAILRFPGRHPIRGRLWLFNNREIIRGSDVIHCHDFLTFITWFLPIRMMYPQKPVYVTFHGHEGKLPIPQRTLFQRHVTEWLTSGNICIGGFIPKWYGTKADLISYGGTDQVEEASRGGQGAIFIGRLEPDTGILTYLEALVKLKGMGRELELDICGDGSLRNHVEAVTKEHDLPVTIHGMVDDPWHYGAEKRFAFVSSYLSILEAMARKKMVYATYDNDLKYDYLTMMPGAEEMMNISSSAQALADSIDRHLADPSRGEIMVSKAYEFSKNNTWTKVAETYLRLWSVG